MKNLNRKIYVFLLNYFKVVIVIIIIIPYIIKRALSGIFYFILFLNKDKFSGFFEKNHIYSARHRPPAHGHGGLSLSARRYAGLPRDLASRPQRSAGSPGRAGTPAAEVRQFPSLATRSVFTGGKPRTRRADRRAPPVFRCISVFLRVLL